MSLCLYVFMSLCLYVSRLSIPSMFWLTIYIQISLTHIKPSSFLYFLLFPFNLVHSNLAITMVTIKGGARHKDQGICGKYGPS